nr:tetratricopeptide repeat protein [Planctomycetota bacterium]
MREEALDLFLILVDVSYPADLRTDCAEELDTLIAGPKNPVRDQLESVLFSAPLPQGTKLAPAKICVPESCATTGTLLTQLEKLQPSIRLVCDTWGAMAEEVLESDQERREADAAFVRTGAFRQFVLAVENGENPGLAGMTLMQSPKLKQRLPASTIRRCVSEWQKSLATMMASSTAKVENEPEPDEYESVESQRITSFNRAEAGKQAQQQIDRIVEQLRAGNLAMATRWTRELVEWHLKYDEGEEYACKSLCNLAIQAQNFGQFDFQLEVTQQAIEIYPQDPQAKNQLAHAWHKRGDFETALTIYEEAAAVHPENVVAKTGRAEVLKATGDYAGALAAYEEAAAVHPENVVAKTGR